MRLTMISFINNAPLVVVNYNVNKVTEQIATELCWSSNTLEDKEQYSSNLLINVLKTLLFIKYAKVETKILPPNSKTKSKTNPKEKYINDTKEEITILDSKWFTTLVKSEGFKVRGHFRLQPCGVGRLERELIWIENFEKTGYTASARKLILENNPN